MADFNNIDELMAFLEKEVNDSMKDVGKAVQKVVKDHVDLDVYAVAQPAKYERTEQLRDSVTYTVDGTDVLIHHDDSMIESIPDNQHHSVVEGYEPQDSSEYVANIVEEGSSGHIFGEGYWTEPRPFWKNAEDEVESTGLDAKILKDSLKTKGFNVE